MVEISICDVFSRNELYVSEIYFKKTLHKYATMISDDFDLSPKSKLSIGNAYFSFILLFSTFYSLFEEILCNISRMNFVKQN